MNRNSVTFSQNVCNTKKILFIMVCIFRFHLSAACSERSLFFAPSDVIPGRGGVRRLQSLLDDDVVPYQ